MTVPSFRSVCALTGQKSGVPAVLAAADEIGAAVEGFTDLQGRILADVGVYDCPCGSVYELCEDASVEEFAGLHRWLGRHLDGCGSVEVERLNRNVEMLTKQLDGMFEAHVRVDELTAQCAAQSDEIRSLNLQLDSMRAGQPKRGGW